MPRHGFRSFGACFAILLALSLLFASAESIDIGEEFPSFNDVLALCCFLFLSAPAAVLLRGGRSLSDMGRSLSAPSFLLGFASHPCQAPPFR